MSYHIRTPNIDIPALAQDVLLLRDAIPTLTTERVETTFYVVEGKTPERNVYTLDKAEALSIHNAVQTSWLSAFEPTPRQPWQSDSIMQHLMAEASLNAVRQQVNRLLQEGFKEHTGEVTLYHYSIPTETGEREEGTLLDPQQIEHTIEKGFRVLYLEEQSIAVFFGHENISAALQEPYIATMLAHHDFEAITDFHTQHFSEDFYHMVRTVKEFLHSPQLPMERSGTEFEKLEKRYVLEAIRQYMRLVHEPIIHVDEALRGAPLEWLLLHEYTAEKFEQFLAHNISTVLRKAAYDTAQQYDDTMYHAWKESFRAT